MSFKKQVKMMGVYLLGRFHAVNTPLPHSQWTSEKKKKKRKRKEKKKRKQTRKSKVVVEVNFLTVRFNSCLVRVASQSQKALTN